MSLCGVETSGDNLVTISGTPIGGSVMRSLSGMDCGVLEKILWILKEYPVKADSAAHVVALTDLDNVNFHIAQSGEINKTPRIMMNKRGFMKLDRERIIATVNKLMPLS